MKRELVHNGSELKMKTMRMGLVTGAALAVASAAWAADYTYTGLGSDPGKWNDAANWGGVSYPSTGNDGAIFPNGIAATITSGMPSTLYKLVTGNQLVTFYTGLNFTYGPTAASVSIGTGGLTVNSTTTGIAFGSNGEAGNGLTSAGPVTMGRLQMSNQSPVQTGGSYWDITKIELPGNNVTGSIRAWDLRDAANTTITAYRSNGGSYEWTGNPVFSGGRPNWDVMHGASYGNASKGKWDLKHFTLYGNRLQIDGSPDSVNGPADYLVSSNGTVDVNSIRIALGSTVNPERTRASYVALSNSTIFVRGSGTAWENNSTNNVRFDVTTSTVHFVPAGGALTVDTGSQDRSGDGVQTADWDSNFAFGNVVIGTGAAITLTGNNNFDNGTSALYVKGTLSGAGTIVGGGRSVFVHGGLSPGASPGTLTVTNGNLFLSSNVQLSYELGPTDGAGIGYLGLGSNDYVQVFGNLTLDGTLNVTRLPGSGLTTYGSTNVYRLFDYTGSLTDNGLLLDPSVRYAWVGVDTVNKQVNLYLWNVPEPSTLFLFAGGLAALGWWRRGRA